MYDPNDEFNRRSSMNGGTAAAGAAFLIMAILAGLFVSIGAIAGAFVLAGLSRVLSGKSIGFKQFAGDACLKSPIAPFWQCLGNASTLEWE